MLTKSEELWMQTEDVQSSLDELMAREVMVPRTDAFMVDVGMIVDH